MKYRKYLIGTNDLTICWISSKRKNETSSIRTNFSKFVDDRFDRKEKEKNESRQRDDSRNETSPDELMPREFNVAARFDRKRFNVRRIDETFVRLIYLKRQKNDFLERRKKKLWIFSQRTKEEKLPIGTEETWK